MEFPLQIMGTNNFISRRIVLQYMLILKKTSYVNGNNSGIKAIHYLYTVNNESYAGEKFSSLLDFIIM